ncbi:hypothetical protein CF319_g9571 [Tilletia indica]|nr:hypothetical protein CF319_g9571 [Tilletia indica]
MARPAALHSWQARTPTLANIHRPAQLLHRHPPSPSSRQRARPTNRTAPLASRLVNYAPRPPPRAQPSIVTDPSRQMKALPVPLAPAQPHSPKKSIPPHQGNVRKTIKHDRAPLRCQNMASLVRFGKEQEPGAQEPGAQEHRSTGAKSTGVQRHRSTGAQEQGQRARAAGRVVETQEYSGNESRSRQQ